MTTPHDRPEGNEWWFDGDYSEKYLAFGWVNKARFAAWVNQQEVECNGASLGCAALDVKWGWAYGGDRLWETFKFCKHWRWGARRITECDPMRIANVQVYKPPAPTPERLTQMVEGVGE